MRLKSFKKKSKEQVEDAPSPESWVIPTLEEESEEQAIKEENNVSIAHHDETPVFTHPPPKVVAEAGVSLKENFLLLGERLEERLNEIETRLNQLENKIKKLDVLFEALQKAFSS